MSDSLPQEPPALAGSTIHETMLDVFADLRRAEGRLHELAARMSRRDAAGMSDSLLEEEGVLEEFSHVTMGRFG